MITLSDLFWAGMIFLAGAYWWKAREVKEVAYQAAKSHCQRLGLEFLDDSVVLRSIRLQRSKRGGLFLLRTFGFEFSSTGEERYGGQIQLLGRRVQAVQLDAHRFGG